MDKSKFKLLVATPMYNASKYIDRLAESIREYDVEWLVLDDGSTDDTLSKMESLVNSGSMKITLYSNKNRGLTYARNFLSDRFVNDPRYSDFTHMAFIDADDYFLPGWLTTIEHWHKVVSEMFPDEKSPYLCFKYWNERRVQDECQIYTKLNTHMKAHQAVCQYDGGGFDVLHVIPKEYLIEVKEFDGNYYHVCKGEKWTPDCYNFMNYTDYPASFISDMVAALGVNDGNMSDTYYENIATKYAKGQLDEIVMFMDVYGSDSHNLGIPWRMFPGYRWRWYLKCLTRMIHNGTLVFANKKWDDFVPEDDTVDSKHPIDYDNNINID